MITLQQAYAALQGRKEFVITETEKTISFDYIIVMDDSFNDMKYGFIRRNFRGITFGKNGELLSLPFPKFFNINQNSESQFVDHKNKNAVVYEKADGTMIHCYLLDGNIVSSTCRSSTNIQSKDALNFINADILLQNQIFESINLGFTPIFEWVAPHNQVVVWYERPRLVYLMSRNRKTGNYLFEEKYADKVRKFDIRFGDILNSVSGENFEGYVCHLEDGNIFKVKTPWYLLRHRSVDLLSKPKYKIYEVALNGYIDDVISLAPITHVELYKQVQREVEIDLLYSKIELEKKYMEALRHSGDINDNAHRKRFVELVKGDENFAAYMMMLSGKNPDGIVKKRLLGKYQELYPMRVL